MEQKCNNPFDHKPIKEYPDILLILRWSYLSLRPNRQNDVTYYRHFRAEPTSGCHRFWDFILNSEMLRATIYILLLVRYCHDFVFTNWFSGRRAFGNAVWLQKNSWNKPVIRILLIILVR